MTGWVWSRRTDQGWRGDPYADWMHADAPSDPPRGYMTLDPLDPAAPIRRREAGTRDELLVLDGAADWGELAVAPVFDAGVADAPHAVCAPREFSEGTVIVAVIDDGVGFLNPHFHDLDGARFEAVWLQGARPAGSATAPFGRALSRDEINAAWAACAGDEEAAYRRLGAIDPSGEDAALLLRRQSHGTAVASLAAGGLAHGKRSRRPLLAVDLPPSAVGDTSGVYLDFFVIAALRWIEAQADRLCGARPHPIIINISLGLAAGPHDGGGRIERCIDRMITAREAQGKSPLRVVLPTGNGRQTRARAQLRVPPGAARRIIWRIQPDDGTPSFVEAWAQEGAADWTLSAAPPCGCVEGDPGDGVSDLRPRGRDGIISARVYKQGRRAICAVGSTAEGAAGRLRGAPHGAWTLSVRNSGETELVLDLRIQRDDRPLGYRGGGRQSYFDSPGYDIFDGAGRRLSTDADPEESLRRRGASSGLATGRESIVVAGWRRSDRAPAPYSGMTDESCARPPDAAAVCEDALAHAGVLAPTSCGGRRAPIGGTSMAAPQIARWSADRLEAWAVTGASATKLGGREQLGGCALIEDPPGPEKPSIHEIGHGRIPYGMGRRRDSGPDRID